MDEPPPSGDFCARSSRSAPSGCLSVSGLEALPASPSWIQQQAVLWPDAVPCAKQRFMQCVVVKLRADQNAAVGQAQAAQQLPGVLGVSDLVWVHEDQHLDGRVHCAYRAGKCTPKWGAGRTRKRICAAKKMLNQVTRADARKMERICDFDIRNPAFGALIAAGGIHIAKRFLGMKKGAGTKRSVCAFGFGKKTRQKWRLQSPRSPRRQQRSQSSPLIDCVTRLFPLWSSVSATWLNYETKLHRKLRWRRECITT